MGNRNEAGPPRRVTSAPASARRPVDSLWFRRTALVVVVGTFAWWVSSTTPFTETADLAVTVGLALMAIPAAASLLHHDDQRAVGGHATASPTGSPAAAGDRPKLRAWLAAVAAVAAYELFTYFAGFGGDRHPFPTLSSLYDSAASSQAAKALFVLGWMALGWGLFRRRTLGAEPGGGRPG